MLEDTPRSTRYSARLRAHLNPFSQEEATIDDEEDRQLGAASDDEFKNAIEEVHGVKESPLSQNTANDTTPTPEDPSGAAENLFIAQKGDAQDPGAESDSITQISRKSSPGDDQSKIDQSISLPTKQEPSLQTSNTSSPSASRKRKSHELEDNDSEFANTSISPAKKAKIEDIDLDRVSEQPSQNGRYEKNVSISSMDGAGDSQMVDEPQQAMNDADTTPETGVELSPIVRTRGQRGGRGRRRGRGARSRPAARATTNKRGAGRGRASRARGSRGGRHFYNYDDPEFRRSPSPSAEAQKLRDRQRELDKAFRKVAAAQRLALAALVTQSEKRLTRDKSAHIDVAEYEEVNALLRERLLERQTACRRKYELEVEQENRLFAAECERINAKFRVS